MKKLLIVAASMLAVVTTYGQGRVNWSNPGFLMNTNTAGNTAGVPASSGNTAEPSGTFRFGLYLFAGSGATSNQLTQAGVQFSSLSANPVTQPGRFAATTTLPLPSPFNGDNVTPYTVSFQVRGWKAVGADTTVLGSYEAAQTYAAAHPLELVLGGASAIGFAVPTYSPTLATVIFGNGAGQIQGFDLVPLGVPEPSSIALGLLGLGAIAMFRRRK